MTTKPRHRRPITNANGIGAGVGVDKYGGTVVDPTANVRELVSAEGNFRDALRDSDIRYQDAMRDAQEKYQNGIRLGSEKLREFESKLQNWMRDAESKRSDQLADLRQVYEKRIADMLAESVRTTSTLVSTQLVQIQATFDTRVSKLEAFQFTQAGRSSVQDPVMSDTLTRITLGLANLRTTQDDALAAMTKTLSTIQATENRAGGSVMGREQGNARLLAIVMAVAAIASPVIAILVTIMAMRGGPH